MKITINTTTIAINAKKLAKPFAKCILLSVFSTGWLVALGAVIIIPAEILRRDVEVNKRTLEVTDRYAKLIEVGSIATQQQRESAQHEIELFKRLIPDRLERQLQDLDTMETAAMILCFWLALVIVFWLLRLGKVRKTLVA